MKQPRNGALDPRTAPLGIILVAGLPTAQAIEAVGVLATTAVIERAILAETRCQARSAVLGALETRLAARRRAERSTTKGAKNTKGRRKA